MNNSEIDVNDALGFTVVDTDSAEAMGVAGSYVRPSIDVRTEATIGLVKYKAPSAVSAVSSTEGAVAAYEAKETDELFEDTSDDSSSDEDPDEMPVCITVTATCGIRQSRRRSSRRVRGVRRQDEPRLVGASAARTGPAQHRQSYPRGTPGLWRIRAQRTW
jgi:hypothetical protein